MREKPKRGMRTATNKKTTEPRKEKMGPKLKADRTSETSKREKEGNGRIVKSKTNLGY